jgi:hypothetical protein
LNPAYSSFIGPDVAPNKTSAVLPRPLATKHAPIKQTQTGSSAGGWKKNIEKKNK